MPGLWQVNACCNSCWISLVKPYFFNNSLIPRQMGRWPTHFGFGPNKHNLVGPRPVSYRRGGIISASYYCNGPAAGRCSSNLGIRVTRGSPPAASRVFPGYSLNTWHRSTPPQAQPCIARTHYVTSSFLESDFEQFNYHTQVAWPTQKCHVATRASSLVMAVSKQRSVRENV